MMLQLLAQADQTFWMPEQASSYAHKVDGLFYYIFYISVFFFVLIGSLMFFFAWKFRQRDKSHAPTGPTHSTTLEITWTIIPTVIVISIFVWGFVGYLDMASPPDNAYEITVESQRWGWRFVYPNGAKSNVLHVPDGKPVRLVLRSSDVIHSFYCPEFRIKKDAVPGRYNKTWFQPVLSEAKRREIEGTSVELTDPKDPKINWGTFENAAIFDVFCTEYCGQQHALMRSYVVVSPPERFAAWVAEQADVLGNNPPAEAGKLIYAQQGCNACHSVDGTSGTGPTFKDLFGKRENFKDGSSAIADENYIYESIRIPGAKIVMGYDNVMPAYSKDQLSDREMDALIAYM
ncbi:MAG: cytochrome c oxidase subunit II, partial [Firmicutes bacterium]|nr:cytochrome c oxidase subunit II [Bacillota bacterium]